MHTFDLLMRGLLIAVGVAMFAHFVAMNNFIRRAPGLVKFLAIPALAAVGMYLIGCGIRGYIEPGFRALALSSLVMLALYLSVWASGGHVSEVFEQRAQARDLDRMPHYVREAVAGYEFVTEDIVTDSGMQELQEATRREGVLA
jgi:hypothetical protein